MTFVQMLNGDFYLLGYSNNTPAIFALDPNGNVSTLFTFSSGSVFTLHPISPTELLVNVMIITCITSPPIPQHF
ncbi:MAG: hypothetical protein R2788_13365 [Saprospiraceae bacterium]